MRSSVAFAWLASLPSLVACATPPVEPARCVSAPAASAAPVVVTAPPAPSAAASAAPPVNVNAPRGKVAVAIVVDQLASWVAAERWPHLPNGGFARLRREGTWVKNSVYLHAVTETAPGHASLFTGRIPREHRIVANSAMRTDLPHPGTPVRDSSLIEDQNFRVVGPTGINAAANGVSLANVRGQTLADALRERDDLAVVVALSLKDRGSVFAGGRNPNASIWYNEGTGTLVTSTAFAKNGKLPAFAQPFAKIPFKQELKWAPFDSAFVEAHQQTPDEQPGESLVGGGTRKFPHVFDGEKMFGGFRLVPEADALLVDLAIASLALRQPEHPMLLSISFSTNDVVGHSYGPNSWEAWSEIAALDAALLRLFSALDVALGADGYSVVLSADHGIVPMPEVVKLKRPDYCNGLKPDWYERPCFPGMRALSDETKKRTNAQLVKLMGLKSEPIDRIVDSRVVLSDAARSLPAPQQKQLDLLLRTALKADPSVLDVFAIRDFGDTCPPPPDQSIPALVCRGNTEDVSAGFYNIPGDYYVVLKNGHYWGWGDGVNHGSPYLYDRSVPLLVRYPGAPHERVVEQGVFGSFYASLWYALTGEVTSGPYGGVVGAR